MIFRQAYILKRAGIPWRHIVGIACSTCLPAVSKRCCFDSGSQILLCVLTVVCHICYFVVFAMVFYYFGSKCSDGVVLQGVWRGPISVNLLRY